MTFALEHLRPHEQCLSRMLVDQVQHPSPPGVMCSRANEVVRPHMILMRRPQPHARSIVGPQPAPSASVEPSASRDARCVDTILAYLPAILQQQHRDPAMLIMSILVGEENDGLGQAIFILTLCLPIALACRVADEPDGTLRGSMLLLRMRHLTSPSLGA